MKLFMITNEEGARTTLHCATATGVIDGAYYDSCKEKTPSDIAQDERLADELWTRSEQFIRT